MAIRSNQKNRIRVVVAGDPATGKSSLIVTAVSKQFPTKVPPVLPPNHIPADVLLDRLPITIIDTPSGPEHSNEREHEFLLADVVVLTYARNNFDTFENLKSYWLPELRRLKLNVPVVVAGCKADLKVNRRQISIKQFEESVSLIQKEFPEIETYIDCSAYKNIKVLMVFNYALRHIVYPIAPLFDVKTQSLTPQCRKSLKRIFLLCDLDRDGALNDAELNEFQVKSFNVPLKPSEIAALKRAVQDKLPEGVNERGLTLEGFLFHHESVTGRTGIDLVWIILQKFGYNDDIRLDYFLPPFKQAPDQSMELTDVALDFLREIFSMYYKNNDGVICAGDVEHLFSTAPDCPWSENPYMGAVSTNVLGGLTQDGFLSEWVLMTLLEPAKSVEYLKYIMYDGDAASAIRLTRRRLTDRKKRQSERTVYQCFVFGPKNAGKTALLDGFVGRSFSDTSIPNTKERYAVNVVNGTGGSQKFLVLREIPEAKVKNLLSDKESLAACDVALFVYDSTDESSFTKTAKLLAEVARHGENTGYKVPSLIVSAKDDLNSYAKSIKDSTRLSQDVGIDAPVPVSAKRGDLSDIFRRIVTTAEHPHLNIPEPEVGRSRKQYLRLVNPSFMADSGGAAGCHYRIGCLSCLFYVFLGHE
ncbi:mitochondrial Rho GTPase 1-like [Silene latifolia]|uniref:mitochondrial Rho GTPase 1-like n=1 Tax=Silene latifolia TaxID=37657 RepID=UPI003D76D3E6